MVDNTGINAVSAPLASSLCVLGLIVASRYKLKRWTAISQLLPPAPASDEEIAPAAPAPNAEPTVKGWRRFFTRRMMKQYFSFIAYMGLQAGIVFGLPRLATKFFMDCFFGMMMFGLIVFSVGMASTVIVPSPMQVKYERKTTTSGLTIKDEPVHPEPAYNWIEHARTVVAVTAAAAIFFSAYHGYTVLQSFATVAWSTMLIASWGMPKLRVKRIVQFLLGVAFGVPALTAIIVPICTHFFGEAAPNHPSRGVAAPSDWILSIMPMAIHGFPVLYPGPLLAMTLRFDYARSSSSSSIALRSSGPIAIPAEPPHFPSPLFNTGIFALTFVISASHGFAPQLTPLLKDGIGLEYCTMLVSMVGVVVALASRAWRMGVLREWWTYEEAWIPNKAEVAAILMDHAEQAPSYTDEKSSDEDTVEERL